MAQYFEIHECSFCHSVISINVLHVWSHHLHKIYEEHHAILIFFTFYLNELLEKYLGYEILCNKYQPKIICESKCQQSETNVSESHVSPPCFLVPYNYLKLNDRKSEISGY